MRVSETTAEEISLINERLTQNQDAIFEVAQSITVLVRRLEPVLSPVEPAIAEKTAHPSETPRSESIIAYRLLGHNQHLLALNTELREAIYRLQI